MREDTNYKSQENIKKKTLKNLEVIKLLPIFAAEKV
jgi:hypothetical protein